ncbi:MAG: lantibiotic dehydratase [Chitinophagales bacterium]|nr:lantibiotic dehydratase [Chitinophagales bacterium]
MQLFQAHSRFFLRSPLLPVDVYMKQVLEAADLATQRAELLKVFQNSYVRDALYLASPVLYAALQKLESGQMSDTAEITHCYTSLLRYFLRMSTRCTPFGLFAGCTVGEWSDKNEVQLLGMEKQERHTRPDMNFICQLAQNLSEQEGIREHLLFYPNNSHYRFGNSIRFVDYHYRFSYRFHRLAAVEYNEYFEQMLERAKQGATIAELAEALTDEDVSLEEATEFIQDSIEGKLLVSELDANVSGPEMLDLLRQIMERMGGKSEVAATVHTHLMALKQALDEIDRTHLNGTSEAPYADLKTKLETLLPVEDQKHLIQVDLYKPAASCTLHKNILAQLQKGLHALNCIYGQSNEAATLDNFRKAFETRYETRAVPLLEALDAESGIPYNASAAPYRNPLIHNLPAPQGPANDTIRWTAKTLFWYQKLTEARENGNLEVNITDEDLKLLGTPKWDDLPDSFVINARVLGDGEAENPRVLIANMNGPANRMIGRFTHLHPEIDALAKDIAHQEDNLHEKAILAEIVHLPESRVGNVLMRTQLHAYEIPYLAKAAEPEAQQISLQDLLVQIVDGEIHLYSQRLGKRVLPIMSNAHNYTSRALPVYQFLCDLQGQKKRSALGFSWPAFTSDFQFLPRVSYQNVVLARAIWRIKQADIKSLERLCNAAAPDMLPELLQQWRKPLNLPERVVIVSGDNELLIDFNNSLSIQTFLGEARSATTLLLAEYPGEGTLSPICDESGAHYQHEILAVFTRNTPVPDKVKLPVSNAVQRSFSIGSEWVYFKIYCGNSTADELLLHHISPLVDTLKQQKLINHWFFIRYNDPDTHLRLRFRLSDTAKLGHLMALVYEHLAEPLEQGLIWRLMTDTYQREVERYGMHTIELAEQLFAHDSETVLQMLALNSEAPEPFRWHFALLIAHNLYDVFGMKEEQQLALAQASRDGFELEYKVKDNPTLRKTINDKARGYRQEVVELMERRHANADFEPWFALADAHRAALAPIAAQIQEVLKVHPGSVGALIGSYIHMSVNRLFPSSQRTYELMVYTLLTHYYNYRRHTAKNKVEVLPVGRKEQPELAEVQTA